MRKYATILVAALMLTAAPQAAHAAQNLDVLLERLVSTSEENSGDFGIAALDLATDDYVGVNLRQAFPMASTMKVAVAAMYLTEVDAGRRTLQDPVGGSTAYAQMDRMMVYSDNGATDRLIATLGGPVAVNSWLQRHQIAGMRVDRTIAQLLAARRNLWEQEDTSTPYAMMALLRAIDKGPMLTPQSRSVILDMMRRCATGRNRIKGILPAGATVEHKTGTLNGYTGDVGYLTTPQGRRIIVVFFARGGDNRAAVIATAARTIYDAFATNGTLLASR